MACAAVGLVLLFLVPPRSESATGFDPWVHPRGETYDAGRHYRDDTGELYYHAENDLHRGLGPVIVGGADRRYVSAELGRDLFAVIAKSGGTLYPVLHYDTNGDGAIDRTIAGRVEGTRVVFDKPGMEEISFARIHWQIGVQYRADESGNADLDRRYLASVDSGQAQVEFRDGADLADVGARGPFGPGLVILKFREGNPFDLADFAQNPARYTESFDALTRGEDADDWTVVDNEGHLQTHFEERDLFLVRTTGTMTLQVEWGDMPIEDFMGEYLHVTRNGSECYSTLDAKVQNEDGTPVEAVPQTLLYCPDDAFALFEAPDGYQVQLAAFHAEELYESTDVGTSIGDNVRLYVREIFPRQPSQRETGSVGGNVVAGFRDAGDDMLDSFGNAITGTQRTNMHTGETRYKPSIITGVPLALASFVTLKPGAGFRHLFDGVESLNQAAADVVSAVNNTVINPPLQVFVGSATSTNSANATGDYVGAGTQAVVKNLPLGARFNDALNPVSAYRHNRAWVPEDYTRTDTQLNIDRIIAIIDAIAINAIINHNDNSSSGAQAGDDAADIPGPVDEPPIVNPPGGGGGGGGGGFFPRPRPRPRPMPRGPGC